MRLLFFKVYIPLSFFFFVFVVGLVWEAGNIMSSEFGACFLFVELGGWDQIRHLLKSEIVQTNAFSS